jgi:PIN domain nuclease of toxin-antitoxin system
MNGPKKRRGHWASSMTQKNKRFLIDSHIFVWLVSDLNKLSKSVLSVIDDPDAQIYLSFASLWELRIKQSAKKLPFSEDMFQAPFGRGLNPLPISLSHIRQVGLLPFHHHDPFDRMLIAQAQCENMTLISSDRQFVDYEVSLLKA